MLVVGAVNAAAFTPVNGRAGIPGMPFGANNVTGPDVVSAAYEGTITDAPNKETIIALRANDLPLPKTNPFFMISS
jgi:hypothetical protein